MRLIILTQYYPPEVGAPQNRLHELAIRMAREGWEIEVMTAMPNYPAMEIHEAYKGKSYHYETIDGIPVHRSSIYVSKEKSVISRLLNYFSFVYSSWKVGRKKLKNADYLMVESPPLFLGLSAAALAKKKGAKMIFNVSDLWPESAEKLEIISNKFFLGMATKLEEWCYRKASFITGQTQGIVKDISSRFPQKRVYWLPNGVDLNFYKPGTEPKGWRESNGFKSDDILLLYAGIHGHAQGLEVILKAADLVRDESKVHFIFVGSGPEKDLLERMKADMKLESVHFFGLVPKQEMPGIVGAADAAVVPLKKLPLFEGAIPSKIFENLAMKKPLFLGVSGEAKELFIEEGQAGLYFEPENHEALAACIKQVTSGEIDLRELGENGRDYVSRKFNRELIAEGFSNELKNL